MIRNRIPCFAALAVIVSAPALAADRQPLVLDTQRGISDGQSGVVLQNAPLSRAPMVQAQSPARATELAPSGAPTTVIVEPTLQMPGTSSTQPPARVPRW